MTPEQLQQLAESLGLQMPPGVTGKPGVTRIQAPLNATVGEFGPEGPEGIVNHHTAGSTLESALGARNPMTGQPVGYNYYITPESETEHARIYERIPPDQSARHMGQGRGLRSSNTLSVAAVAPSDAAITEEQRALQGLLNRSLFQSTSARPERTYGHGELQSNKEADEGALISSVARSTAPEPRLLANLTGNHPARMGLHGPSETPPSASPRGVSLAHTPEQGGAVRTGAATQGQGRWSTWAMEPGNRAFLINMGLNMMTGGWGGSMDTLARSIAAGFQAKQATEEGNEKDILRADEEERRYERHQSDLDVRSAQAQNYRMGGGARTGRRPLQAAPDPASQQFLEVFGSATPSVPGAPPVIDRATWERENGPGGIIPAVFGGPQPYERAGELLQQVQNRSSSSTSPAGEDANLGMEELIGLGASRNPADIARFQLEARRRFKIRGDVEPYVNPETGQISFRRMAPTGGGGRGGAGGRESSFATTARAGMDSARLSIDRAREYIHKSPIEGSLPGRAIQQTTGTHNYARVMRGIENSVKSYVHARSGAQVAVKEFDQYMQTMMPQAMDSETTIMEKLARLELDMMLIGRRFGENVSEEDMMQRHNDIRKYTGLPPDSPDRFRELLPQLEGSASRNMGVRAAPTAPPGTTVQPPRGERVNPPANPQSRPPGGGWGPIERID